MILSNASLDIGPSVNLTTSRSRLATKQRITLAGRLHVKIMTRDKVCQADCLLRPNVRLKKHSLAGLSGGSQGNGAGRGPR